MAFVWNITYGVINQIFDEGPRSWAGRQGQD